MSKQKSFLMVSLAFIASLFVSIFFCVEHSQQCWAADLSELSMSAQVSVSKEALKTKIREIEKTTDFKEDTKQKLLEFHRKSLENLETASSYDALADKFVQSIETAPVKIKKIREELETSATQPESKNIEDESPDNVSLKDIEQQLLRAKANFTVIDGNVMTLAHQVSSQTERPIKASQRLAEIKKREEESLTVLKGTTSQDEPPQLTEARSWMQETLLKALRSETKMLNQELVSMPILVELANAQLEKAKDLLERARDQVQRLESKANRLRQDEAARSMGQAEEAMRQVADGQPVLQKAAAANTSLGDELQIATASLERLTAEKAQLTSELVGLEETFRNTKQKLELTGLSQAQGLMLHEKRRNLPKLRLLQRKATDTESLIAETGLLQVQHGEERKRLDNVDGDITKLTLGSAPEEIGRIKPVLHKLLTNRRELLDKILITNQACLGLLADIEGLNRQLIATVTSFDSFLAERLLWARNTPVIRLKDFQHLPHEIAEFIDTDRWVVIGKQLADTVFFTPVFILACLVSAVLLRAKNSILTRLDTTVHQACNPASYRFALPLKAIGLILLLALPYPLLIITFGWQMHLHQDASDFSRIVAMALIVLAGRLFFLLAFRILLAPQGLAADFFRWQKSTTNLLRQEARYLIIIFLPAVFLTQLAFFANYSAGSIQILGRLTFIATLAILSLFFYRVLHHKSGVWQRFLAEHANQFPARFYPVFFSLLMLIPLVLVGLILAGYVFAAGALVQSLINSIWVTLGLVVCHQLIKMWLIQSSRHLAFKKVLGLQVQTKTFLDSGQPSSNKGPGPIEEPVEDLIEMSVESRKLLNTVTVILYCLGLWLVWAEVMPALRFFDEITLWGYTTKVNGQATVTPVTLGDVGLTVLIGIITLTATRHFPSLLKIVLLQHLDMTAGSRYTATTLTRYLIGGTGLLMIANILGFSWAQIQWLVAALGVGIGFGLQEIVANFISGLIILFERPIRVGDIVTIGTTDGVVTRIRIRATTIRDFDRKELLVPNKEFISGRLLNWSLSDPVIRLLLPVGIAYGSDVQQAIDLMKQSAEDNALILDDPKPSVTFDSFGDNSLLLTLRCFVSSVDDRTAARSMLHQVIDQQFRATGISMAFPQRDVHLDTSKPLDIRIMKGQVTVPKPAIAEG